MSVRFELYRDKPLGRGSFGIVCQAKYRGTVCAAKIMHPTLVDESIRLEASVANTRERRRLPTTRFDQEITILKELDHPNIIKYLHATEDPNSGERVLLMELMHSNLDKFLNDIQPPIAIHTEMNICLDIIEAIAYLHSHDIAHRDLSSKNVLLTPDKLAKLSDFGMAKLGDANRDESRHYTTHPGCENYMPPEAFEHNNEYTNKLDCFSFGVLIIQILTRKFPDPGNRTMKISHPQYRKEIKVVISEVDRRRDHICLVEENHPLKQIALDCLKDEEADRPSAQALCEMVRDCLSIELRDVTIESAADTSPFDSGSYGIVHKANFRELECHAFISKDIPSDSIVEAFRLSRTSPRVLQFIGAYSSPESAHLVVLIEDHMMCTLTNFMGDSLHPIPFQTQVNICSDVAQALEFLHSESIFHKNLSSDCVLLDINRRAKLTSFRTVSPQNSVYLAPEIHQRKPQFSEKSDYFAFGVLIIQILTRKKPEPGPAFNIGITKRLSELVRRKDDIHPINSFHPLLQIAIQCLQDRLSKRPSPTDRGSKLTTKLGNLSKSPLYKGKVQICILAVGKRGKEKSCVVNGLLGVPVLPENEEDYIDPSQYEYRGEKDGIMLSVFDSPDLKNDADLAQEGFDLLIYITSTLSTRQALAHFTDKRRNIWRRGMMVLTSTPENSFTTNPQVMQTNLQAQRIQISEVLTETRSKLPLFESVPILPAGASTDRHLPDHEYWLSKIWRKAHKRLPENPQQLLLVMSEKRIKKTSDITDEDFTKKIHDQPIEESFYIKKVIVAAATTTGVLSGVIGATVGATIGALAIGLPTFGVFAGLGLALGGVLGGAVGVGAGAAAGAGMYARMMTTATSLPEEKISARTVPADSSINATPPIDITTSLPVYTTTSRPVDRMCSASVPVNPVDLTASLPSSTATNYSTDGSSLADNSLVTGAADGTTAQISDELNSIIIDVQPELSEETPF